MKLDTKLLCDALATLIEANDWWKTHVADDEAERRLGNLEHSFLSLARSTLPAVLDAADAMPDLLNCLSGLVKHLDDSRHDHDPVKRAQLIGNAERAIARAKGQPWYHLCG